MSSVQKGYSLYKSLPGLLALLFAFAMILVPLWGPYLEEYVRGLEGPAKWVGPLAVFFVVLVAGPLWFAFKESKEKDKKIEALTVKIAEKDVALAQQNPVSGEATMAAPGRGHLLEELRKIIQRFKNCHTWLGRAITDPLFKDAEKQLGELDGQARQILHDEHPEKLNDYLGNVLLPESPDRHRMRNFCSVKIRNLEMISDKILKGK